MFDCHEKTAQSGGFSFSVQPAWKTFREPLAPAMKPGAAQGLVADMVACRRKIVINFALRPDPNPAHTEENTSRNQFSLLIYKSIFIKSITNPIRTLVHRSHKLLRQRYSSRRFQAWLLLCAVLCLPACAAPKQPQTPVARFLQDRGLISADGSSATGSELFGSMRDRASDLVLNAMNFLGVPYRYGGTNEESGFDCSGFTRHVFESSLGLLLPRRSEEQANASGLMSVGWEDMKPGDLVFFNTMRRAFSHVGIYVGDGKFIHSPRTGSTIRVEDMRAAYWTTRFNGARRAPDMISGTPPAGAVPAVSSAAPY